MAVNILYDNGVPSGAPFVPGWAGELLTYSESLGTATVVFEAGEVPVFIPAAGDVALIYNIEDLTDFGVFYITGAGLTPPVGDHPVAFNGNIDKKYYNFAKKTGETYNVIVYSDSLYSDVVESFANSFKVSTQIQKAYYSDLLVAYSKRISHTVVVDDLRRKFWSNRDAFMANTMFLIDTCSDGKTQAYKVTLNDTTFEVFNNKFKSSLSFNLASSRV